MTADQGLRPSLIQSFEGYAGRLKAALAAADWNKIAELAETLLACRDNGRHVFVCGNGGSAGNAIHMANDFLYGITRMYGRGLRVTALPANASVITCLANDEGYDTIFSHQLAVQASPSDVLIVLSGSGNSPNILRALDAARELGVKSFAILGFSGGRAKEKADVPIHFAIDDMQISEDLQMVVAHMIMQWLYAHREALA